MHIVRDQWASCIKNGRLLRLLVQLFLPDYSTTISLITYGTLLMFTRQVLFYSHEVEGASYKIIQLR